MSILITFKKGKKQYTARIDSFNTCKGCLWLYIYGENGNCGYVKDGKVTEACICEYDTFVSDETAKVIRLWGSV